MTSLFTNLDPFSWVALSSIVVLKVEEERVREERQVFEYFLILEISLKATNEYERKKKYEPKIVAISLYCCVY